MTSFQWDLTLLVVSQLGTQQIPFQNAISALESDRARERACFTIFQPSTVQSVCAWYCIELQPAEFLQSALRGYQAQRQTISQQRQRDTSSRNPSIRDDDDDDDDDDGDDTAEFLQSNIRAHHYRRQQINRLSVILAMLCYWFPMWSNAELWFNIHLTILWPFSDLSVI